MIYDYKCKECSEITTQSRNFEERKTHHICNCRPQGSIAEYQFPVGAVKGFQPFETYYDEALDTDITGRKDKRDHLRARGWMEVGDKVRGARNFDEKAPHHVKPMPPRGTRWTQKDSISSDDMVVGIENNGKIEQVRAGELKTIEKSGKSIKDVINEA